MTIHGKPKHPQHTEFVIQNSGGANRLYNYFGEIHFTFNAVRDQSTSDTVKCVLGDQFQPGEIIRATATGAIGTCYHDLGSPSTGWELSDINADWDDETGQICFSASLKGEGVLIHRIHYNIQVLAKK